MAAELEGTISRLAEYAGTITSYVSEMSAYYVMNRPEITGLTGGTPTKLDGFDITNLKTGNPMIALFFSGSIVAIFRLRAKALGETAVTGWKVLSTSDAAYLWELVSVTKEGCPCEWNATTSKWYQRIATGSEGAVASGLASTGFVLP